MATITGETMDVIPALNVWILELHLGKRDIVNRLVLFNHLLFASYTSNGGCRREEKSRKHWSLFTKFLFSVTANLFIC